MFKKLLLLSVLVVGALWGAGYDLETISAEIGSAADNAAGDMSGRNAGSDWGN